jgi:flagellar assembly factor FliW
VKVITTRFGELNIVKADLLNFPEGILGFDNLKKFFIVDPGDKTLILWLQSVEDSSIAFPIIEPKIIHPTFSAKLLPADLASLNLKTLDDARIYCILTIPQDVLKMSANFKAPIIINNETLMGKQIVLQDSKLTVKHEIYNDIKKIFTSQVSDDSIRSQTEINEETQNKAISIKKNERLKIVGQTEQKI